MNKTNKLIVLLTLLALMLFLIFSIRGNEYCGDMTFIEAQNIAIQKCNGIPISHMCNEDIWIMGYAVEKKSCQLICEVNTVTGSAILNWNCPGMIT